MTDEGKWRLLNPLTIRFSQPRINPYFRDGRLLHETIAEICDSALAAPEGATAAPAYDVLLVPPFPAIRVISWLPKIRNADGEAERDEYGDAKLGQRAWFALDNRRLNTLQRAAAKHWPQRCCVAVRCIEEVPGGSIIRELRKFRTTTQGTTIEVGMRSGDLKLHAWWEEVTPSEASNAKAQASKLEPDGLFAEDLWDAEVWAPHAVAKAVEARGTREERHPEERTAASQSPGPAPRGSPPRATDATQLEAALIAQAQAAQAAHAVQVAQMAQAVEAMQAAQAAQLARLAQLAQLPPAARRLRPEAKMPRIVTCPSTGWQYMDPAGRIQGPFGLDKMRLWHIHGFFYPDLPMRCNAASEFVRFSELWPPGIPPFSSQVIEYRA